MITFADRLMNYVDISEPKQADRFACPNNCGRQYSWLHRKHCLKIHLRLECVRCAAHVLVCGMLNKIHQT